MFQRQLLTDAIHAAFINGNKHGEIYISSTGWADDQLVVCPYCRAGDLKKLGRFLIDIAENLERVWPQQ